MLRKRNYEKQSKFAHVQYKSETKSNFFYFEFFIVIIFRIIHGRKVLINKFLEYFKNIFYSPLKKYKLPKRKIII